LTAWGERRQFQQWFADTEAWVFARYAVRALPGVLPAAMSGLLAMSALYPSSVSDCDCGHLPALEKDLVNAIELRSRFLSEAERLNQKYPAPLSDADRMSSMAEEQRFTLQTAPEGIDAPPGYTGPSSVDYTPRDIAFDNLPKYKPAEQCQPGAGSQQDLRKAEKGSVCGSMADAIRAHEQYHQAQCVAAGGSTAYFHKSGAEKAAEEAAAYQAQIDVLQAGIDKVRANIWKCARIGRDR
jgi:hypothetical protein